MNRSTPQEVQSSHWQRPSTSKSLPDVPKASEDTKESRSEHRSRSAQRQFSRHGSSASTQSPPERDRSPRFKPMETTPSSPQTEPKPVEESESSLFRPRTPSSRNQPVIEDKVSRGDTSSAISRSKAKQSIDRGRQQSGVKFQGRLKTALKDLFKRDLDKEEDVTKIQNRHWTDQ